MRLNRHHFNRFAMLAEETTDFQVRPENWLNVYEVGDKLKLDPEESRQIAIWMNEMGWATINFTDPDAPKMRLTVPGRIEISKLFDPWWMQALRSKVATVVISFIGGMFATIIVEYVKRLIWQ